MESNGNNDIDEDLYSDNLAKTYNENKQRTKNLTNKALKGVKKIGKNSKTLGSFVKNKALIAIMGTTLLIVAFIIFLIGIIAFIMTGPFSMVGWIVKMADEVYQEIKIACVSVVSGDDYAKVTDEHVKDVAQYIENMGYNLKGYGFIGFPSGEDKREDELKSFKRDNNNLISSIKSSLIVEYLAAENRTYMLSTVSLNSIYRWWKGLDLIGKISSGDLANQGAENQNIDTGMLNVSKQIDGIGIARCAEDGFVINWDNIGNTSPEQTIYAGMEYNPGYDHYSVNGESQVLSVTPEIDREKRQLKLTIEQGYVYNGVKVGPKKDEYIYNLEGWTGRYGKPIEFLLSLHLGTMSPGFAEAVATRKAFDTKVNIRIHKAVDICVVKHQYYGQLFTMDECVNKLNEMKIQMYNRLVDQYNMAARARSKT